ncbi:FKBP-type peptidyl-prolyl cis-trans isomerase [Segetibacter sp. 3557_3]|uniref:FKBP-type peptidyl-prolyl cis-trans isomerase n=1 Tax=Segetibacter sp. 3557_3 TaxID=2547429 RepID=UPI0010589A29|nr:FKBP-type peptidyl-prolyl cis-trans isomerase [Segetibacter sp. 3557_3]TDH28991.1 FKBP-type peptidyl-prolyl cis-trans isomerase [Segetibacter sp. 3557_3]
MKKHFVVPALLLASLSAGAQVKPKPKTAAAKPKSAAVSPLKTNKDSLSYAFGISLGEYLKSQGVESLNYALLNKAIDQSIKKQKTYFDFNQANAVIGKMGQAKMQKTAMAEKAKGDKFLAENRKRAGVKVTESGMQYEILKAGTGPMPKATDTISAHYAGTLLNGTEFDNSYKRGQPLEIPVSGVIKGWTEALQMMPVGSKWKLYIPSTSAYGDYGAGNEIPGGATLVFEIELLDIVNKKTQ